MATPQKTRDGRGWLRIIAVTMCLGLFVCPLVLNIPLFDPDEGLHASIAQEMVEQGDWVTPRLRGEPFWDKPILYFWAEAFSLKCFGMDESAVRLPGILFGLLGVATTALVAWRLFDRTTGTIAALTYATMILPTAMAQAASHDVALVPWVNLGILLFWEADRADSRRLRIGLTLAVGVVLGLACLTKGLVGVALIGVAYGSALLVLRRFTWAACLRGAVALSVAALVAGFWYLAMELRNPGYLYYYFVERHLLGYVTETQRHGKAAFWFYVPVLLSGGLPWIAYLPALARHGWDRRRSEAETHDGSLTLVWCWLLAGTLLLSLAQSKMVTYIWPMFPAVAILAAVAWARLFSGDLSDVARRWLSAAFLGLCLTGPVTLPTAMLVCQQKYHLHYAPLDWLLGITVALSSWIPMWIWWRGWIRNALTIGTVSMAAQFAMVMVMVLPPIGDASSARALAAYWNARQELPPRLLVVDERIGSLIFYLTPALRQQLRPGQIESVASYEVDDPPTLQAGTVLAVAERRLRRLPPQLNLTGVRFEQAGQYRIYPADALAAQLPRPLSSQTTDTASQREERTIALRPSAP